MLFSKPEISQQRPSIAHEDIGQLEVAVEEVTLRHLDEPAHNVFGQLEDIALRHPALLLEGNTQIPLITVFSDDIAMRCFPDDIIATQNIGMLQTSQRLDLAI